MHCCSSFPIRRSSFVLFVASLFLHLEAQETLGPCAIQTYNLRLRTEIRIEPKLYKGRSHVVFFFRSYDHGALLHLIIIVANAGPAKPFLLSSFLCCPPIAFYKFE